jgi:hypothetical protein
VRYAPRIIRINLLFYYSSHLLTFQPYTFNLNIYSCTSLPFCPLMNMSNFKTDRPVAARPVMDKLQISLARSSPMQLVASCHDFYAIHILSSVVNSIISTLLRLDQRILSHAVLISQHHHPSGQFGLFLKSLIFPCQGNNISTAGRLNGDKSGLFAASNW